MQNCNIEKLNNKEPISKQTDQEQSTKNVILEKLIMSLEFKIVKKTYFGVQTAFKCSTEINGHLYSVENINEEKAKIALAAKILEKYPEYLPINSPYNELTVLDTPASIPFQQRIER